MQGTQGRAHQSTPGHIICDFFQDTLQCINLVQAISVLLYSGYFIEGMPSNNSGQQRLFQSEIFKHSGVYQDFAHGTNPFIQYGNVLLVHQHDRK